MCAWCDRGEDLGEARNESLSVRLMNFILHRGIYELRIWWRVGESGGKEGEALEVEDL